MSKLSLLRDADFSAKWTADARLQAMTTRGDLLSGQRRNQSFEGRIECSNAVREAEPMMEEAIENFAGFAFVHFSCGPLPDC